MRNTAILIFDDAEVLDFCGPFEVFSVTNELNNYELFNVYTVARGKRTVRAKNGLKVQPAAVLDQIQGRRGAAAPDGVYRFPGACRHRSARRFESHDPS